LRMGKLGGLCSAARSVKTLGTYITHIPTYHIHNMKRKTVAIQLRQRPRNRRRRTALVVSQPRRRTRNPLLGRIGAFNVADTDAGLRYLESAVAPKDFAGILGGIPDAYCGKSAVIRQKLLLPVGAPGGTSTNWNASIVIPPIPNVAAMIVSNHDTASKPNQVGASWTVFDYANASTIFPSPGSGPEYGTSMVQMFRFVSLTAELKMVGPVLSTGGTISAARVPGLGLQDGVEASTFSSYKTFTGFDDIDQTNMQQLPGFYVGHVNLGTYGWSIHQDPEVSFSSVWLNSPYANVNYTESAVPTAGAAASGFYMGFGTQQPLGIAITNATPSTAFVLEVEAIVEYQPRANSLMAEMMSDAPPHDQRALDSYQKAVRQMPAFVPVSQNSGFWDMFLKVVSFVSPFVGRLFGPVGTAVGAGISAGASLIGSRLSSQRNTSKLTVAPLD
jgi:hypothetical protein